MLQSEHSQVHDSTAFTIGGWAGSGSVLKP